MTTSIIDQEALIQQPTFKCLLMSIILLRDKL